MGDDSLERFAEAVERVRRDPSEVNARQAVHAARVAWASVYATLLLAGGFRRDTLDAFATAMDDCLQALRAVQGGEYIDGYRRQVSWYRQLIARFRRGGLHAVNDAIDEAIQQRSVMA
jgi:hypothetical protein